jgi:2-polyprenyl-3-methyl-5-hydroxy-6-metoxy-1,4-benzoquinol methylase
MSEAKYEKHYKEGRNILGDPFPEYVQFFESYSKKGARVLDIGCGQGRDALFVARMGHSVLGIDLSETGIRQMLEDAVEKDIAIRGVVADLIDYEYEEDYDVVVIDRVLHMISDRIQRNAAFQRAIASVKQGGYALIADEKKNLADFGKIAAKGEWKTVKAKGGFLFIQKARDEVQ